MRQEQNEMSLFFSFCFFVFALFQVHWVKKIEFYTSINTFITFVSIVLALVSFFSCLNFFDSLSKSLVSLQTTEYVVLHTDLASEDIQNVEIVTDGNIDPDTILSHVTGGEHSYVVVSEPGNHYRIIDSSTGMTLATMPVDSDQLSTVTMMPGSDGEGEILTVETDSGPLTVKTETVESDSVKAENSSAALESIVVHTDTSGGSGTVQTETGGVIVHAETAPVSDAITVHADSSHVTDAITVHTDASHNTGAITVETAAGPVTVVGGDQVADAVKQAMMVADMVESTGGEHGVEIQVVVTKAQTTS